MVFYLQKLLVYFSLLYEVAFIFCPKTHQSLFLMCVIIRLCIAFFVYNYFFPIFVFSKIFSMQVFNTFFHFLWPLFFISFLVPFYFLIHPLISSYIPIFIVFPISQINFCCSYERHLIHDGIYIFMN